MADLAQLTKKVKISAMHDLSSEKLSEEENKRIFGKCFKTHGHDYHVEVTVEGPIDPQSGLICDRDYFEDVLIREIQEKYDKTYLNDFFRSSTGENLVSGFFHVLKEKLLPLKLVKVRIQETAKNSFTYGGEGKSLSLDL